jgi:predicted amidohydrolase YtcJ
VLIRASAVHTFDGDDHGGWTTVAIRGSDIVGVGADDELDGQRGHATHVIDEPGLVVLPGFYDSHIHQYESGLETRSVSVDGVRSITDLVDAVATAARDATAGTWLITSCNWHESELLEQRLPTADELDRATTEHPVCVRRGSHLVVTNHYGLKLAGIDDHGDGRLIGDDAIAPVLALLPEPTFEGKVESLKTVCELHNSRGIVAARDPGIATDDVRVYQELWRRGGLTVRSVVMVRMDEGWPLDRMLAEIDRWGVSTGFGNEWLRLGGIKFFVDGRIDDAAVAQPHEHDPSSHGVLYIDRDMLEKAVQHAVQRGWEVGCHAVGDVAVEIVLDAYEAVLGRHPNLRPGALVIEHAMLAPQRLRRRAVDLGVGISVHPPIQYALGADILKSWGPGRAADASPVRDWVAEGALIAAGSDGHFSPWDPLLAVWMLMTRNTKVAGTHGATQAVDARTAFDLYTVAGARLLGEDGWRGALTPGRRADLVAFRRDPLTCDVDDLPGLTPVFTVVDGRPVFDLEGLFRRSK